MIIIRNHRNNTQMITIGILTALGLTVGASFGKSLGVAVGAYLVACIVTGALRKC